MLLLVLPLALLFSGLNGHFEIDYNKLTPKQKQNLENSIKRIEQWNKEAVGESFGLNHFALWSEEEIRSMFRRDDSGFPKVAFQCGGNCWEIKPKPLALEDELEYFGKVDPNTFRKIESPPKENSAIRERPIQPFASSCFAQGADVTAGPKSPSFYNEYSHLDVIGWMRHGMGKKSGTWSYKEVRFLFLIGALGKRGKHICLRVEKWKSDNRHGLPHLSFQFGGRGHSLFPKELDEKETELDFFSHVDPITYKKMNSVPERGTVTCEDYRFDIRRKWPQCADIISEVRDQSKCHCCYAVAGAAALTDRFCIALAKRGWPVPPARRGSSFFSAADIMQCGRHSWEDACRGDFSYNVWRFLHEIGVVSGHHYNRAFNWYTIARNIGWEQVMKEEIFHNGSVPVDLNTLRNFVNYDGGILRRRRSPSLGGHIVRLIGYGRVNCTDGRLVKYWLGVNSWNKNWGENGGFFRITRGLNEFGIESRDISFGHIELP